MDQNNESLNQKETKRPLEFLREHLPIFITAAVIIVLIGLFVVLKGGLEFLNSLRGFGPSGSEIESMENNNTNFDDIEKVSTDGWVRKYYQAGKNVIILTIPPKDNLHINSRIIYKEANEIPDHLSLNSINLVEEHKVEAGDYTIVTDEYYGANNWHTFISEIGFKDNSHAELRFRYITSDANSTKLTREEWDTIMSTAEIKEDDGKYDFGTLYDLVENNIIFYIDPYSLSENPFNPQSRFFEVDVNTFEALEGYYAKDKNSVFHMGIEIENADPKTFKLIEIDIIGESSRSYVHIPRDRSVDNSNEIPERALIGVDSDGVYIEFQWLKGVSPENVKIEIGSGMGSVISDDDTRWYYQGYCHDGLYVPESEMLPYGSINTKEDYLDKYLYC